MTYYTELSFEQVLPEYKTHSGNDNYIDVLFSPLENICDALEIEAYIIHTLSILVVNQMNYCRILRKKQVIYVPLSIQD